MTSRPCGVCLILNNHNFAKSREGVLEHKHMKDRNGTDVDAGTVNVKDEFANSLKIETLFLFLKV